MAVIDSEPVKSPCGDENAIRKVMGKRKFDEEEDSDSDVEEVVSKEIEYDVFNDDDERPHIYRKAMYLELSDDECEISISCFFYCKP